MEETRKPDSLGMVGLWMILLVACFPDSPNCNRHEFFVFFFLFFSGRLNKESKERLTVLTLFLGDFSPELGWADRILWLPQTLV